MHSTLNSVRGASLQPWSQAFRFASRVTSPLQSLSGRGAEASRVGDLPTSVVLRCCPAPPAEADVALLLRHSRGVDVFFKVLRASLAAHWFAAPAPTFSLSTAILAVFARPASSCFYTSGLVSLRELHLSLGAQAFCPASAATDPGKGSTVASAPLMRLLAPTAHRALSVHRSASSTTAARVTRPQHRSASDSLSEQPPPTRSRGLASAALFRPRRFTRPRRFAPLPAVPGLPGWHSWGCTALQGLSRFAEGASVSGGAFPSWRWLERSASPRASDRPAILRLHSHCAFKGLLLRSDRHRPLLVSLQRGFDPLMGFTWVGPRFALPEGFATVRSRHVPNFQRACGPFRRATRRAGRN